MIDRNFVIGLLLAITVIVTYNMYYEYKFGEYTRIQEKMAAEEKSKVDAGDRRAAVKELEDKKLVTPMDESSASTTSPGSQVITDGPGSDSGAEAGIKAGEKQIRVTNGVVDIVLSNRGGVFSTYKLTKYRDLKKRHIDLIYDPVEFVTNQNRLERMARENNDKSFNRLHVYPTMGLKFPKHAFSKHINDSIFNTAEQRDLIELKEGDKPLQISYELVDESGVVVKKSYTFYPGDYRFDVAVTIKSTPQWGVFDYSLVWFGLGDEQSDFSSYYSYNGAIFMKGMEKIADSPDEDTPVVTHEGYIKWAALAHRYFTVFAKYEDMPKSVVTSIYLSDTDASLEWRLKSSLEDKPIVASFYAGPKTHEQLNKYNDNVVSIINYGWFDIIAKPMYWLLEWFYKWTGNWGWAIILLTIVTKVLFFPLTQKGFKSMSKLQKLQPQMKKLQEAYKNDKETLNQEMIALYKQHKVNPMGGCMPLILQIPIFFALYKVLLESIELKGAAWILWIHDLSLQDPYYVSPILMGLSMFAQQAMTPKTGDPMQRKVMMAMPLIFTIMFLQFPSGLVIYWLVNNILTIGQQWLIYREAK